VALHLWSGQPARRRAEGGWVGGGRRPNETWVRFRPTEGSVTPMVGDQRLRPAGRCIGLLSGFEAAAIVRPPPRPLPLRVWERRSFIASFWRMAERRALGSSTGIAAAGRFPVGAGAPGSHILQIKKVRARGESPRSPVAELNSPVRRRSRAAKHGLGVAGEAGAGAPPTLLGCNSTSCHLVELCRRIRPRVSTGP